MPKHPNPRRGLLARAGRALLFLAITAVLCGVFRFLLVDDVHAYTRVMLEELYAQAGQVDTLFLGSCHCYRAFGPAAVDKALGTHSFNAGSSQQLPDGSYYLLREAASINQLDTVYLETFYTGYNQGSSDQVPLACYLITDYLRPTSLNRYAYLWEMGGAAAFADLIFPARHAIAAPGELPALWKAKLTDGYQPGNYAYLTYPGEEEYRGNGFVYTFGVNGGNYDGILNLDPEAPLSDFGRTYLEAIADFCQEQGIRLVLVTAPLPSAFVADTAHYQAYVEAMRDFAAAHGTEYWDFTLCTEAVGLELGTEDFSDAHHLNGQGAEKFTAAFCRVAADSAAGRPTGGYFYDTLDQKLTQAPDGTLAAVQGQAGEDGL